MVPTVRRCALLCVILGAHLLLFRLISLSDNPRRERRSEEALASLFFVDLSKPEETQTDSSSARLISTYDPALTSRAARDITITLPPDIEGTDTFIDWDAEASRVAKDAAMRMGKETEFRSLDHRPTGMGPLPPKSPGRQPGQSEHYEGGVIIDWTRNGCYYSNQNAPIAAFGPALRLQLPTCTGGGGGGGKPLPTFEEWKKERDERQAFASSNGRAMGARVALQPRPLLLGNEECPHYAEMEKFSASSWKR